METDKQVPLVKQTYYINAQDLQCTQSSKNKRPATATRAAALSRNSEEIANAATNTYVLHIFTFPLPTSFFPFFLVTSFSIPSPFSGSSARRQQKTENQQQTYVLGGEVVNNRKLYNDVPQSTPVSFYIKFTFHQTRWPQTFRLSETKVLNKNVVKFLRQICKTKKFCCAPFIAVIDYFFVFFLKLCVLLMQFYIKFAIFRRYLSSTLICWWKRTLVTSNFRICSSIRKTCSFRE